MGVYQSSIKKASASAVPSCRISLPTDRRDPVGGVEKECSPRVVRATAPRLVVDARPPFLEHDIALRQDDGIVELQSGHAIGLQRHHQIETIARDSLVEDRVIRGH